MLNAVEASVVPNFPFALDKSQKIIYTYNIKR